MKFRPSIFSRRAVSLLLSTALCTGLLAFPAHASVYVTTPTVGSPSQQTTAQPSDADYIHEEFVRINGLSSQDERYNAYNALCERYPDVPGVHYRRAVFLRDYEPDKNKVLQAIEQVIQLAKNYPNWETEDSSSYAPDLLVSYTDKLDKYDIQSASYKLEADIYLNDLYQQEAYISAMRKALQVQETDCRRFMGEDVTSQVVSSKEGSIIAPSNLTSSIIQWRSAVGDLCRIEAYRRELNDIEAWYQAGGSKSFTAWDGRVQVDCVGGTNTMQVSVQSSRSPISSVQTEFQFNVPVKQVLRGVDKVYFLLPKGGYSTQTIQTTWYTDGSEPKSQRSRSTISFGTFSEFCTAADLDLPQVVLDFVGANTSDPLQSLYLVTYFSDYRTV